MTFYEAHVQRMAQHLADLWSEPGWRDYVKQRLEELKAADPMYLALPGLMRQIVDARAQVAVGRQ